MRIMIIGNNLQRKNLVKNVKFLRRKLSLLRDRKNIQVVNERGSWYSDTAERETSFSLFSYPLSNEGVASMDEPIHTSHLFNRYKPINAYGVIGDCHSVVLVAPDGAVDWGCLPDFDSPAIFCRLLDAERGGYFQIAPSDPTIRGTQRYLRGSNVLQTRFTGPTGELVLTDFMPVETLSAWQFREMNNNTWTREDGSCHSLVRIVECTSGELPLTVRLKATPNYAAAPGEVFLSPNGTGAVVSGGQQHVGLAIIGAHLLPSFSMCVVREEDEMHPSVIVQVNLREGERLLFTLGVGRTAQAARRLVEVELLQRNFDAELAQTLHCWRKWLQGLAYHGPYAEMVERSALVLKMMTYAPTGAIVAAPTTSLPEGLRSEERRVGKEC